MASTFFLPVQSKRTNPMLLEKGPILDVRYFRFCIESKLSWRRRSASLKICKNKHYFSFKKWSLWNCNFYWNGKRTKINKEEARIDAYFLKVLTFESIGFVQLVKKVGHSRPLFIYFRLFSTVDNKQMFNKILLMTAVELRTSGIESDHSTNWATTISQHDCCYIVQM